MNSAAPQTSTIAETSPFVQRLLRSVPLCFAELETLNAFEHKRRRLRAGEVLLQEEDTSDDIFILQAGALHSSTTLTGGARQILRIHLPGDLVNTTAVGWNRIAATITSLTAAEVSCFQRQKLGVLFSQQPRLAALFYGVAVVDGVSLCDRLKSLGRTDGQARICMLLLDIHSRQRLAEGAPQDVVELFLTQTDIADAVGMTKVHVNRLLREMTQQGLIKREGRRVRFCDKERMIKACDFVDRYESMAVDWLPAA